MHVDSDETETPETTALLKSNLRDHANRAGFKTSPIGVSVDEQLKGKTRVNNICRTVSRNIFFLSKLSRIVSHQANLDFFFAHIVLHINCTSPQTCCKIFNANSQYGL